MAEESQPWWVLDNGSGTMKASFGPRQSQRLRETMWVITEGKHKGNTQLMKNGATNHLLQAHACTSALFSLTLFSF